MAISACAARKPPLMQVSTMMPLDNSMTKMCQRQEKTTVCVCSLKMFPPWRCEASPIITTSSVE